MVARLGDLLRLTLDDVEAQEVPLWRELEFLRLYLSIEQVRFEDRLRVRIAADPGLSDALVPHMVLQPIVENAVRHGLGQSEEAVTIDVSATRRNGTLALVVSDDGPGLPAGRARSSRASAWPTPGAASHGCTATTPACSRRTRAPRGVRVTSRCRSGRRIRGRAMRLKVLVVDDEPLAREGLKLLLGRQPGVESVSEARNGREAIARSATRRPTWCCSTCRCRAWTASPSCTRSARSACRP